VKRICIVCGYRCRGLVKPFGILTDPVPAHHHHSDKEIRDAWMEKTTREWAPAHWYRVKR
jgi:hypothetical protein